MNKLIKQFAKQINGDSGTVVGRLFKEERKAEERDYGELAL